MAVAAAAGIGGWGLSSLVSSQSQKGVKHKNSTNSRTTRDEDGGNGDDNTTDQRRHESLPQVANDDAEIGFASRAEMQEVSSNNGRISHCKNYQ